MPRLSAADAKRREWSDEEAGIVQGPAGRGGGWLLGGWLGEWFVSWRRSGTMASRLRRRELGDAGARAFAAADRASARARRDAAATARRIPPGAARVSTRADARGVRRTLVGSRLGDIERTTRDESFPPARARRPSETATKRSQHGGLWFRASPPLARLGRASPSAGASRALGARPPRSPRPAPAPARSDAPRRRPSASSDPT